MASLRAVVFPGGMRKNQRSLTVLPVFAAYVLGMDAVDEISLQIEQQDGSFRVMGRVCHLNMAVGAVFGNKAVIGLYAEGHAPVHFDYLPAEKTVKLSGILAPGTGLDHQVGRLLRLTGNLPEDRFVSTKGGIAKEEFKEEGLGLAALDVVGGEGVPPPVIAFAGLGAEELAGVAGDIVFVE